jgi:hypothetical protein
MKTIIDQQKIRKRSTLSNIMSLGGLVTLLASVILPLFLQQLANLSFLMMIIGLGVSMVGIYFANRWVRKPRPEDNLDKALKSSSDSYHLYHYPSLPCDHVLLTPSGVVILETVGLSGVFSYNNGKWKEAMTIGRALRWIVEEHLGNPIRAAQDTQGYLKKRIEKMGISDASLPIKPVVVFTHPDVVLNIEAAPIPVCKVEKLRKQIPSDTPHLEPDLYTRLDEYFTDLTVKS